MDDEGLGISYASHMQDQFEAGYEGSRCLESSFDAEGEHSAESMLQIFASKLMVWVAFKARVVHAFHSRMLLKELCHCKRVLAATLGAERKSFKPLKHQE